MSKKGRGRTTITLELEALRALMRGAVIDTFDELDRDESALWRERFEAATKDRAVLVAERDELRAERAAIHAAIRTLRDAIPPWILSANDLQPLVQAMMALVSFETPGGAE